MSGLTNLESCNGEEIVALMEAHIDPQILRKINNALKQTHPGMSLTDYINTLSEPVALSVLIPTDKTIAEAYAILIKENLAVM